MTFIRLLQGEWQKTKRTGFKYIVILTPIVYPLLILWYIKNIKKDNLWTLNVYSIFYEVIGITLPIIISLLMSLIIFQEEKAGSFKNLLITPVSRNEIYLSKLIMIITIIFIDILIATIILLLGLKFFYKELYIPYGIFMLSVLFTVVGSLFLCGFYLNVSYFLGIGPNLALGGIGFLIGALIGGTGLGDRIWILIPWSWPVRLGMYPGVLMDSFSKGTDINVSFYFYNEMIKGTSIALISFIIITIISLFYFKRWEGREVRT